MSATDFSIGISSSNGASTSDSGQEIFDAESHLGQSSLQLFSGCDASNLNHPNNVRRSYMALHSPTKDLLGFVTDEVSPLAGAAGDICLQSFVAGGGSSNNSLSPQPTVTSTCVSSDKRSSDCSRVESSSTSPLNLADAALASKESSSANAELSCRDDYCSELLEGIDGCMLKEMIKQLQQPKQAKNDDRAVQHGDVSSSAPTILAANVGPLLLEALDGFFLVTNSEGFIDFVSDNVVRHLKVPQESMLRKSIFNFVAPEHHEMFSRMLPDSIDFHLLGLSNSCSSFGFDTNSAGGAGAGARRERSRSFLCRFRVAENSSDSGNQRSTNLRLNSSGGSAHSPNLPGGASAFDYMDSSFLDDPATSSDNEVWTSQGNDRADHQSTYESFYVSAIKLPHPDTTPTEEFLSFSTSGDTNQPCLVCVARRISSPSHNVTAAASQAQISALHSVTSPSPTVQLTPQQTPPFSQYQYFSLRCTIDGVIVTADFGESELRRLTRDLHGQYIQCLCYPEDTPFLVDFLQKVAAQQQFCGGANPVCQIRLLLENRCFYIQISGSLTSVPNQLNNDFLLLQCSVLRVTDSSEYRPHEQQLQQQQALPVFLQETTDYSSGLKYPSSSDLPLSTVANSQVDSQQTTADFSPTCGGRAPAKSKAKGGAGSGDTGGTRKPRVKKAPQDKAFNAQTGEAQPTTPRRTPKGKNTAANATAANNLSSPKQGDLSNNTGITTAQANQFPAFVRQSPVSTRNMDPLAVDEVTSSAPLGSSSNDLENFATHLRHQQQQQDLCSSNSGITMVTIAHQDKLHELCSFVFGSDVNGTDTGNNNNSSNNISRLPDSPVAAAGNSYNSSFAVWQAQQHVILKELLNNDEATDRDNNSMADQLRSPTQLIPEIEHESPANSIGAAAQTTPKRPRGRKNKIPESEVETTSAGAKPKGTANQKGSKVGKLFEQNGGQPQPQMKQFQDATDLPLYDQHQALQHMLREEESVEKLRRKSVKDAGDSRAALVKRRTSLSLDTSSGSINPFVSNDYITAAPDCLDSSLPPWSNRPGMVGGMNNLYNRPLFGCESARLGPGLQAVNNISMAQHQPKLEPETPPPTSGVSKLVEKNCMLVKLLAQTSPMTPTLPTSIAASSFDKIAKGAKDNPNKPHVSTGLVESLLNRNRNSMPIPSPIFTNKPTINNNNNNTDNSSPFGMNLMDASSQHNMEQNRLPSYGDIEQLRMDEGPVRSAAMQQQQRFVGVNGAQRKLQYEQIGGGPFSSQHCRAFSENQTAAFGQQQPGFTAPRLPFGSFPRNQYGTGLRMDSPRNSYPVMISRFPQAHNLRQQPPHELESGGYMSPGMHQKQAMQIQQLMSDANGCGTDKSTLCDRQNAQMLGPLMKRSKSVAQFNTGPDTFKMAQYAAADSSTPASDSNPFAQTSFNMGVTRSSSYSADSDPRFPVIGASGFGYQLTTSASGMYDSSHRYQPPNSAPSDCGGDSEMFSFADVSESPFVITASNASQLPMTGIAARSPSPFVARQQQSHGNNSSMFQTANANTTATSTSFQSPFQNNAANNKDPWNMSMHNATALAGLQKKLRVDSQQEQALYGSERHMQNMRQNSAVEQQQLGHRNSGFVTQVQHEQVWSSKTPQ